MENSVAQALGMKDPDCRSTSSVTEPVVLLHGMTWGGRGTPLNAAAKIAPDVASSFFGTSAGIEQLPDTSPGITCMPLYSPTDSTVTPNHASQLTTVPGADVANVESSAVEHSQVLQNAEVHQQILWDLRRDV